MSATTASAVAAPLRAFLVAAKERAHASAIKHTSPLTYVLGNEGGDMDSVVSAIFTALLLSTSTTFPDHIPVLNFGSRDLTLRKDIEGLLRTVNITNNELLFVDDMRFNGSEGDRFILVDHNVLKPSQRSLWGVDTELVTGVIDHHRDEVIYTLDSISKSRQTQLQKMLSPTNQGGLLPSVSDEKRYCIREVEVLGSAASLVALQWKRAILNEAAALTTTATTKSSTTTSSPCVGENADMELLPMTKRLMGCGAASILLGPVVIDTAAFKTAKGKVTPKDVEAKDFLLRFLQPNELKDFRKSPKKIAELQKQQQQHDVDDDDDDATNSKFLSIPSNPQEEVLWSTLATSSSVSTGSSFSPAYIKISKFYDMLKELKSDVRGLTVDEQLRRDYKKFSFATAGKGGDAAGVQPNNVVECGVSTVLLQQHDIDALFPDPKTWVAGCKSRMEAEKYNLHLSTLTGGSKELQAVFDPIAFPELRKTLEEFAIATKDHVQLEQTFVREFPELGLVLMHWKQHSNTVSRKNLTPLLADHFAISYHGNGGKSSI